MISIIIPAHDEGSVIERCLRSILDGAEPGELEIIVVCNGCRDDTAARAGRFGDPVKVLDTSVASKSHALNLGDQVARGFPRFYIDADVEVTLDTIRRVAQSLCSGRLLAAAPRMTVNLQECSWPVRAYYGIWTRLPYCAERMIGSGFYALSEEGRRRFDVFPDIISDDGFVRLQFSPAERDVVEDCHFVITAPRRLADLISIKTRSQFGKYQLHAKYPAMIRNDPRSYQPFLAALMRQPRLWPCLVVYCFVLYVVRARSLYRFLRGRDRVWDRDDSSRGRE
jgi:glycosyltransferase involved in cell wall biosynthesis